MAAGISDVAGLEQHFLRGHFAAAAGKIRQRLLLAVNPVDQLRNIEAFFVVQAAVNIGDADDFVARLRASACAAMEPTLPNP